MGVMAADSGQRRLTAKGERTRSRIVAAAAELVLVHGVADTTLEAIKQTAGVSSSQLYHYFADKDALLQAVIQRQTDMVLKTQEQAGLGTPEGLRAWRDSLVTRSREVSGAGGHPLGHLVGQLAETDENARGQLADAFDQWVAALKDALSRLQDAGHLRPGVHPDALAITLLATLQGGFLVSQVERDAGFLETALDTLFALVLAEPS
jgi:AcrR family transcriptional regulator